MSRAEMYSHLADCRNRIEEAIEHDDVAEMLDAALFIFQGAEATKLIARASEKVTELRRVAEAARDLLAYDRAGSPAMRRVNHENLRTALETAGYEVQR